MSEFNNEISKVPSPLVSVIIPYYRHLEFIGETITSVYNQNYCNFELIVVDDGSNDGSECMLRALQEQFGFQLFVKENGGVSSALNLGVKKSIGKYICLIGSDDVMETSRISKQVDLLESDSELSGCSSYVTRIDSRGFVINRVNPKPEGVVDFNYFFSTDFYFPGPAAMYRAKCLREVELFSEGLAIEDWDMYLKLTRSGKKMFLSSEFLTRYRVHNNTSANNFKMFSGIVDVLLINKEYSKLNFYKIITFQLFRYIYRTIKDKKLKDIPKLIKVYISNVF